MPNEVAHARSMTIDGLYSSVAKLVSKTWKPVVTFVGLNLLITLAFLSLSPSSSHIGTLRPESTIAPKLLELALVGLGVGLVASLGFRSLNLSLITLGIAFVALLDLDHLPSVFGIDQPIRPAHSLFFLILEVLILYLSFGRKGQLEIPIIAASAFFAHMAVDTGEFAIFAPFTFSYSGLASLSVPFAIAAICLAALAGYVKQSKKQAKGILNLSLEDKVYE